VAISFLRRLGFQAQHIVCNVYAQNKTEVIKTKKINWLELLISVGLIEAIGYLGSYLSGDMKPVYIPLAKPPLAPPTWMFSIVWPILYALIGIAAYRIYRHHSQASRHALIWFGVQLFFNFWWSIVFFRFELFWAAAAVIVIIGITAAYTTYLFSKIDKIAQWLMVPYLLWVLFAAYLNIGLAILN
jgi:benzodiazapine receptor